ncbi:MAG: acetyl-CoA carboxylase biotin carboxyl carrier protein subunit, partial [Acidimicrobiia bacterium]
MEIVAPVAARVAAVTVEVGSRVRASDTLVVLEVMKMEHPVTARVSGRVDRLHVEVGEAVEAGTLLVTIDQHEEMDAAPDRARPEDLSALDEVMERHVLGLDQARPEAVATRHESGHRTTREMLGTLCHEFVEYGPLAIAAQRGRRDV